MNFSQVFQRSISAVIRKKEALQERVHEEFDFSSVVERLRKEKEEFEANFLEEGKKAGLAWSRTAHYRELQHALTFSPSSNPLKDEHLGDYFAHLFKRQAECFGMAHKRFQQLGETFLSGWKEGVEIFWNEVKDHV